MRNLHLSFLIFFLFTLGFHSQNLKDFSIPKGFEKISEVKGDLDKDGIDEIIVLFKTNIKINSDFDKGYRREFFILKNNNGKLKLWTKNSNIIFATDTGFYPEYNAQPEIKIKNNCLIISQEFNTNSRHTQTYKHTFRFQNGDFYLIGSHDTFNDTCEFNFMNEINFSTGKVIIDEQYSSCDDDEKNIPKDDHKEFIHKFNTLIKMNNFRIGENKFKIPNSNKYLYF